MPSKSIIDTVLTPSKNYYNLDTVGPLYANVGQVDHRDGRQNKSSTLPAGTRTGDGDNFDTVSTSGKEKKSSVLGRFLSRKNK